MENMVTKEDIIGLVGVGTMGKCMLNSILKNGYSVLAYDPFIGAQEFAKKNGAKIAKDINEVAKKSKLIILSLPTPKHCFETINSIKENLNLNQVIVDTSTIGPEDSKKNFEIIKYTGCKYIDAPILGRPDSVGNWLLPAGGDKNTIKNISPVIETFAKKIVYVGEIGSGNSLKLLNQLMFSTINCISAEVMVLAEKVGIDKKVFYDVISNSNAATVSGLFKETAFRIVEDKYNEPTFTVELLCKDVGLGMDMLKDKGIIPVVSKFVQDINELAKGCGYTKEDTSSIAKIFEEKYDI